MNGGLLMFSLRKIDVLLASFHADSPLPFLASRL